MRNLAFTQGSMIPRIVDWLDNLPTRRVVAIGVVILIVVGLLDYVTGIVVTMAPFYLIPIGLVSLRGNRFAGLLAAIVCGVTWVLLDIRFWEGFRLWPDGWNMLMRVGVFVSFALVLNRLKTDILKEMHLNAKLQAALAEVKQLSGLLPICAWCKRIRDENGNWEPIENYISVHSEADFTHGICPDCTRKYHPTSQG